MSSISSTCFFLSFFLKTLISLPLQTCKQPKCLFAGAFCHHIFRWFRVSRCLYRGNCLYFILLESFCCQFLHKRGLKGQRWYVKQYLVKLEVGDLSSNTPKMDEVVDAIKICHENDFWQER